MTRILDVVWVYVLQADGSMPRCVGPNMDAVKLVALSGRAAAQLGRETSRVGRRRTMTFQHHEVDTDAAITLCHWIENYDTIESPIGQGLKLSEVGSVDRGYTFPDAVMLYGAALAFQIHPAVRGEELRVEIVSAIAVISFRRVSVTFDESYYSTNYIHMAPLRLDEFIMIHECITLDAGMLKTAQHHCMFLKVHGPVPPDQEGIEAWAKQVGVWDNMKAAEDDIRARKTRQDAGWERARGFRERTAKRKVPKL